MGGLDTMLRGEEVACTEIGSYAAGSGGRALALGGTLEMRN